MASRWQIECLTDRINSLSAEIQRVSRKDHPYDEPRVVYEALISVLDSRAKRLKDYIELFQRPGGERFLENYYDTVTRDIAEVEEMFSLVDRVDSPRIPFELLRSLSWAAKELVGGTYRVVVRLDPIFNYSIMPVRRVFESRGWQADWLKVAEQRRLGDDDVLLLGIPSAYANSILLNALAAHELGHLLFYAREEELSNTIASVFGQVFPKHKSRLQDYAAQFVRGLPTGSIRDPYGKAVDTVSRLALKITKQWSKELYSDMVATRLLGPAYIAAFDRVLVGLGQPSESHPPSNLRRSLMNTYFKNNFPKIISDHVWDPLNQNHQKSPWRIDELWVFGQDICQSVVVPFAENLKTVMTPFDASPEEFSSLISEMQDHMANLSPPSVVLREQNKWINSNGFWSMLYAAWHFRLNEDRFQRFAERYQWQANLSIAEDALGNLVLQGLRSLELRFRWPAQETQA